MNRDRRQSTDGDQELFVIIASGKILWSITKIIITKNITICHTKWGGAVPCPQKTMQKL